MCGRYVVAYDPETLVSGFSVLRVPVFPKRWNVAPQSDVPVVYETRAGERVVELMRWGLVPSWAADPKVGHKLNNARAEGVFDRPSFRQAIRRRRCLLPASGFYEWQVVGGGRGGKPIKQPWYISARAGAGPDAASGALPGSMPGPEAPGELLAMAGLFEAWRSGPEAPWLLSCCVITCEANALMAPIHDRMPVLVARRDWSTWLARGVQDEATIAPLLAAPPAAGLQAWPVSREVSRGAAEGPQLVQPLPAGGGGEPAPGRASTRVGAESAASLSAPERLDAEPGAMRPEGEEGP